ncbi:MAG: hypothetical protein IJC67_05000 [Clostridia bacterium]|nr:hypothetical protein [Clostridia bacterium]
MHTKVGIIILLILLLAALLLCTACKPEPTVGDVTDNTDPAAPKEIASREIAEFYARFFHRECENAEGGHAFAFSVTAGDDGTLTAKEAHTELSAPADEAFLLTLQEIIEAHDLVQKNGVYKVTAGLPPEYQPSELTVRYASGEVLTFTEKNDPAAEWSKAVYAAFAELFAQQGE